MDAQRGAAPLIWGRERINPRVCEGWGPGRKSKRGLRGKAFAGCAGVCRGVRAMWATGENVNVRLDLWV